MGDAVTGGGTATVVSGPSAETRSTPTLDVDAPADSRTRGPALVGRPDGVRAAPTLTRTSTRSNVGFVDTAGLEVFHDYFGPGSPAFELILPRTSASAARTTRAGGGGAETPGIGDVVSTAVATAAASASNRGLRGASRRSGRGPSATLSRRAKSILHRFVSNARRAAARRKQHGWGVYSPRLEFMRQVRMHASVGVRVGEPMCALAGGDV